jgi:uncharacterized protein (DUF2237 family)
MSHPDPVQRKIAAETSEACLRALRSWCVDAGRWREEHQAAYEAQIPKIKARWAERRGK